MRADVFLRLQVDTVHMTIEGVLHGKRAPTTGPCADKVFRTCVSGEMLLQLVLSHKRLRAAGTGKRLVATMAMHMPYQLVRRRKTPYDRLVPFLMPGKLQLQQICIYTFITTTPLTNEAARATHVMRSDVIVE